MEEKEEKPKRRGPGGKTRGAGRPKGSRNVHSKDSVKKLDELKFDPIEKMVHEYNEINRLLDEGQIRVGSGAHAQLIATKATLINNLMQYGYKKVPDKQTIGDPDLKPIAIKLTT
jgi:hypothetical protein